VILTGGLTIDFQLFGEYSGVAGSGLFGVVAQGAHLCHGHEAIGGGCFFGVIWAGIGRD
jgi:hypothetical protein